MKYRNLHPWNVSPKEAMRIQAELRSQVVLERGFGEIGFIAGADIALDKDTNKGYAGVIVYRFPELIEVERRHAVENLTFPYIPGLLAFREAPVLLKAFAEVKQEPDVIVFDGQGLAHPRRVGIATHMGLLLDKPSIGCAKSRLIGRYEEPGAQAGQYTPLTDSGETIGAVLRTRDNVNPVFISPGHKVDLSSSIEIIMKCVDGYRIPKPTREADHFVGEVKKGTYTPDEWRQERLF
ncbi:MAG: deoxyribonuclease V [Candidatus Zixiibacteriota bacterium]